MPSCHVPCSVSSGFKRFYNYRHRVYTLRVFGGLRACPSMWAASTHKISAVTGLGTALAPFPRLCFMVLLRHLTSSRPSPMQATQNKNRDHENMYSGKWKLLKIKIRFCTLPGEGPEIFRLEGSYSLLSLYISS